MRNASRQISPGSVTSPGTCVGNKAYRSDLARAMQGAATIALTSSLWLLNPGFSFSVEQDANADMFSLAPSGQSSILLGGSLASCSTKASCVSTSALSAPQAYMPPWLFSPLKQSQAYRELTNVLGDLNATVVQADEHMGFIVAQIPYSGGRDIDEVQFLFRDEQMVLFRCESRITLPDPPFCLRPGCINGPRSRERMNMIRDKLGWSNFETDEDKQWQQMFLH